MTFKYNPARLVAAVGGLVHAIIVLVAFKQGWDADTVLYTSGIEAAALVVGGVLFVEGKSVSVEGLNDLQKAKDDLQDPKD